MASAQKGKKRISCVPMSTRGLFCTSQQLSFLGEGANTRAFLSGERFWLDRHAERLGTEEASSPWAKVERSELVDRLTARGDVKRLAVVCAAGLGKSTNLQWLAKELAAPGTRQVPFFFELDDANLPETLREFWAHTLPNQVRKAPDNSDFADDRLLLTLRRLRALGRITLLLDSIDQASERGLRLLQELLTSADWAPCPIVISARPHAVFDRWDRLIVPSEHAWKFVRIEPLAPGERELLLNQDGLDRYAALPPGGQELMANPRNIEYVRKCGTPDRPRRGREPDSLDQFTLHDLRTASHVFAGAANHIVRYGMRNPKARKLGRRKDLPPPEEASQRQVDFALDLLGALAYTMYCFPARGNGRGEERFRPNVSSVPAHRMVPFTAAVLKRLKAAGLVDGAYRIDDLEDDLDALAELNAEIKYDLLDTRPHRRGDFRWYDRSLQEFFAAWWLSRHAGPRDRERLRQWRYDDPRDQTGRTLYEPLWGFLVEMPRAVRKVRKWVAAVGVLFEHQVPRCCEMIFRSWPGLSKSSAGREVLRQWQQEFEEMLATVGPRGDVARAIPAGLRRCPTDPADDEKPFLMGSPEGEEERGEDEFQHPVVVSPFQMHECPVTNAQYELFDPAHANERWDQEPHPAGEEARDHPVVMVTWFQAWCFARWTGNHLPTEAQWEYACRGGASSYQVFHFGNSLSSSQANFDARHPYGGAEKGDYLACTTRVGSYQENAFGLYDMHGNVWEWCMDWYAAGFYETEKGKRRDPLNDEPASARVLRGGCRSFIGRDCRSAFRYWCEPVYRYRSGGFRLAAVPVVGAEPGKGGSGA
jgi:hypothetical protein